MEHAESDVDDDSDPDYSPDDSFDESEEEGDHLSLCRVCDSQCIPIIEYSKGTMICTTSVCGNGHVSKWQSVVPQQTSMGESFTLKCNCAKWKSYIKGTSYVGPYESKKSQCTNRFQTTICLYSSCNN